MAKLGAHHSPFLPHLLHILPEGTALRLHTHAIPICNDMELTLEYDIVIYAWSKLDLILLLLIYVNNYLGPLDFISMLYRCKLITLSNDVPEAYLSGHICSVSG